MKPVLPLVPGVRLSRLVTIWPICKELGDCGGVTDVDRRSVNLAR
jgi:hypothetical protein